MIMINEQWYSVRDLEDVSNLIREQFNYDLADKMDELIKDLSLDYESDIKDLRDELDGADDEINMLNSKNEDLEEIIESLRDEIYELNNTIERLNEEIDDMREYEIGE